MTTRRIRRIALAGLLALAAFAFSPAAAIGADTGFAAAPPSAIEADKLQEAVQAWILTLSAEKQFASWKQASPPRIEALGPGTHGWLVTLRAADGGPVGYMVVYAAEDGTYRLGEYGTGSQPLFDKAALTRALVENGYIASETSPYQAEKLYLQPFAAVWKVQAGGETYWLDAKTDEWLPLDEERWAQLAKDSGDAQLAALIPAAPNSRSTIASGRLNEAFDPYERLPWLMKEAPFAVAEDGGTLLKRLGAGGHLRYISEPYGDRMLYALAVVGYERWSDGRIDVALDMNGARYVPLSVLRAGGLFYR